MQRQQFSRQLELHILLYYNHANTICGISHELIYCTIRGRLYGRAALHCILSLRRVLLIHSMLEGRQPASRGRDGTSFSL